VLRALRGAPEEASTLVRSDRSVRALLADLERCERSALEGRTLADLAGDEPAPGSVDPRGAAG
jgi:hypothetical protein